MSSSCRTTTTCKFNRPTSPFSMAASMSAPAQLALAIAAVCVVASPQLHGMLASTVTPSCDTDPSCGLHCHVDSGVLSSPATPRAGLSS